MAKRVTSCYDQCDSKPHVERYPIQSSDGSEDMQLSTSTKHVVDRLQSLDSGFNSMYISSMGGDSGSAFLSLSNSPPVDDENVYCMNHARRGHLVLINNRHFSKSLNLGERSGTDVDASSVYTTFKKLGFQVDMQANLTCMDMLRLIVKYAVMDHSDCDCIAIAILSHGDEGSVYGTDGVVELKKLIEPLKMCKSLVGKPKLFFIQACQGNALDEGVDATDAEVSAEEPRPARLPKEADFLYAYSTMPGYFSFRNQSKGSFFIQSISKVFQEFGQGMELSRLLTRVNRIVALEFQSKAKEVAFTGKKQMPCFLSTLTKDLYFTSKK